MKPLKGHTSPETAYIVDDYPYGYTLRCKIRYWIETTKYGQRVCSQTTNPKVPSEKWNKPKKSTYSDLRVMYLDDKNHVQNDGISCSWDPEKVQAFIDNYALDVSAPYVASKLREAKIIAKANSVLTCTIVENPSPEEAEKIKQRSAEAQRKAVAWAIRVTA